MKKSRIIASLLLVVSVLTVALNLGPSDSYIESRIVKLVSEHGSCSGEQVIGPSGESYILTAAHCKVLSDSACFITAISSKGKSLNRKVIAEDSKSDLLLLEGLPKLDGLEIADNYYAKQHVRTFTHWHGFATYKTEGVLIAPAHIKIELFEIENKAQENDCKMEKNEIIEMSFFGAQFKLCALSVVEIASTAFIAPGSSGGLVADDSGHLVGVVSAGGDGYGYFVTLSDVKAFLAGY